MIQLSNGNWYSGVSVVPKNWKLASASLKTSWYITYRYYSKENSAPKQVKIRGGINRLRTLKERRAAVKQLMENEINLIENKGYNPFYNIVDENIGTDYIINPDCGLIESLRKAGERLRLRPSTKSDIKSVLTGFEKAATKAGIDAKPVSQVQRRHIILIFDEAAKIIENWSDKRFNKYRAYLLMLFNELVEVQTLEVNPVSAIKKRAEVKKLRLTLTPEERIKVKNVLKKSYPNFYRFLQIFFHSGARESELLRLKTEDINLQEQYFKITVFKRKVPVEEKRPIKTISLPFWTELIETALPGQYVFSKNLLPGNFSISPAQITRRWRTHIKVKLGIKADFYSLKHLNLDEVTEQLSPEMASQLAGHTSTKMIEEVYAVGHKERVMQKIRGIENPF